MQLFIDPSSDSRAMRSGDDHNDCQTLLSVRPGLQPSQLLSLFVVIAVTAILFITLTSTALVGLELPHPFSISNDSQKKQNYLSEIESKPRSGYFIENHLRVRIDETVKKILHISDPKQKEMMECAAL